MDNFIYKLYPNLRTKLSVLPGQVFTLELQNAFGKSFSEISDFEDFLQSDNEQAKKSLSHPCTGPVEIITDRKHISLKITLVDLQVIKGYQAISKSTGFLRKKFTSRECVIYEIQNDSFFFKKNDIRISSSPQLGFISTLDDKIRSCGRMCENGGNIDLNFLERGSVIYLPVNDNKPRLAVGDLHACQGNGEACGIAVEADGTITLKVEIIDKINFPIINYKLGIVVVGWGNILESAQICVIQNSIVFLKRIFPFYSWSEEEIYQFLSAEGNIIMGNATGKVKTCGLLLYKERIRNKYGFSII